MAATVTQRIMQCRVFEFINPELSRISLAAIVGDIRSSMLEEVDFRKEAAHISEFAQYLERTGASQTATCPFVYRAFSSKRWVLTSLKCL
jgi:aarF domain-containing kinase